MPRTVDYVTMTKNGKEVRVVRSAFEKVWKDRGWSLKKETASPPQTSTQRQTSTKDDNS